MNTGCQKIDRAFKILQNESNAITEISRWTKINKVIHMRDKLSINAKEKIQSQIKELYYWQAEGTPHDPPSEGFLCKECNISFVFPR